MSITPHQGHKPESAIPRLMLVTNRHRCRGVLVEAVKAALAGGVDLVQLREPDLPPDDLKRLAQRLLVATGHDRLVINRDVRLAAQLGVGVHLPEAAPFAQQDRSALAPGRRIGRSVHSPATGDHDERYAADYVVAGHVFPTASHPDQMPLGVRSFAEIVERSRVPVLAIGGITTDNVADVIDAGAAGVAVIGAVLDHDDPECAARRLRYAIDASLSRNEFNERNSS